MKFELEQLKIKIMKFFGVLLPIFFVLNSFGQKLDSIFEVNPKNAIYLELGGNSILYGLNYERGFSRIANYTFAASIGYGFSSSNLGVFSDIVVPFEIKMYNGIGKKNHLEFGLGATYFYDTDRPDRVENGVKVPQTKHRAVNFIRLGYRYTSNNGILLRVGFTPLVAVNAKPVVNLFGGISLGYRFK